MLFSVTLLPISYTHASYRHLHVRICTMYMYMYNMYVIVITKAMTSPKAHLYMNNHVHRTPFSDMYMYI